MNAKYISRRGVIRGGVHDGHELSAAGSTEAERLLVVTHWPPEDRLQYKTFTVNGLAGLNEWLEGDGGSVEWVEAAPESHEETIQGVPRSQILKLLNPS